MKTIQIISFIDLLTKLQSEDFLCGHVIYRGVTDQINHKLIPSFGRLAEMENFSPEKRMEREELVLKLFRHRSYGDLAKIPATDLIWLALAQHHRLTSPE